MNEARTDNCEGLSISRRPSRGSGCHENTARKRRAKEENKTAISCYLKATKESKRRDRKRTYDLWNGMEMFEIME